MRLSTQQQPPRPRVSPRPPTAEPAPASCKTQLGMEPTPSLLQKASLNWQQLWDTMSYLWPGQSLSRNLTSASTSFFERKAEPMGTASQKVWPMHERGGLEKMPQW